MDATAVATGSVDRSTNAPSILAINGVFCGVTVAVMVARMYVRTVMLKAVGIDDWLILAATICGTGVFACYIGETANGMGMHALSLTMGEFKRIFHWQFFHSLIVTVGISLVKISVAFFLLRLGTVKAYKIFLYCVIAFLVAFTIASAGTIMFACTPVRASWDPLGEPNARCFSTATFTNIGLFNSIVNILTDVLFATLPIPIVWKLQVNMRTKVSLVGILSLGYFACACSIVKTRLQVNVFTDLDSTRNDTYAIWNSMELYVGILAASLPGLRPLFKTMLDFRTRLTNTSNAQRHKYYMQDDNIGMDSLPKSGKYNVNVSTKSQSTNSQLGSSMQSSRGGQSELYFKSNEGADSLENILPIQGQITKRVDISVER